VQRRFETTSILHLRNASRLKDECTRVANITLTESTRSTKLCTLKPQTINVKLWGSNLVSKFWLWGLLQSVLFIDAYSRTMGFQVSSLMDSHTKKQGYWFPRFRRIVSLSSPRVKEQKCKLWRFQWQKVRVLRYNFSHKILATVLCRYIICFTWLSHIL
jgi:hypothetical protein